MPMISLWKNMSAMNTVKMSPLCRSKHRKNFQSVLGYFFFVFPMWQFSTKSKNKNHISILRVMVSWNTKNLLFSRLFGFQIYNSYVFCLIKAPSLDTSPLVSTNNSLTNCLLSVNWVVEMLISPVPLCLSFIFVLTFCNEFDYHRPANHMLIVNYVSCHYNSTCWILRSANWATQNSI